MTTRRLILAGGGHAHLHVLERLAQGDASALEVVLVTPSPWQHYSGMLPGWIEGLYREDDLRIDLRPLAARASVSVNWQRVAGLKADERVVELADGSRLEYDLLSLDTGAEPALEWAAGLRAPLIAAKPIASFQAAWSALLEELRSRSRPRLAVVGGGAAGAELSLAIRRRLMRGAATAEISLVTGRDGLLPGHGSGAREKVRRALEAASIEVVETVARAAGERLSLGNGRSMTVDAVVAAAGSRAPAWLSASQVSTDDQGYVSVDACQRSVSHPDVFAVGDVSARVDVVLPRSGVHAVRAGPVLAYNLLAASAGRPLRSYRPSRASLYIMATGGRSAVASWGGWSAEGAWVWRWKDAIDRRFMRRFGPRLG